MPTRPRFRLRTLLLWVAFVAVACAAIASANESTIYAILLAVLGIGILNFSASYGPKRAFWAGFTVGGLLLTKLRPLTAQERIGWQVSTCLAILLFATMAGYF